MERIGDHEDPNMTAVADGFVNGVIKLNPEIGGTDAMDADGRPKAQFTTSPITGDYSVASDGFVLLISTSDSTGLH